MKDFKPFLVCLALSFAGYAFGMEEFDDDSTRLYRMQPAEERKLDWEYFPTGQERVIGVSNDHRHLVTYSLESRERDAPPSPRNLYLCILAANECVGRKLDCSLKEYQDPKGVTFSSQDSYFLIPGADNTVCSTIFPKKIKSFGEGWAAFKDDKQLAFMPRNKEYYSKPNQVKIYQMENPDEPQETHNVSLDFFPQGIRCLNGDTLALYAMDEIVTLKLGQSTIKFEHFEGNDPTVGKSIIATTGEREGSFCSYDDAGNIYGLAWGNTNGCNRIALSHDEKYGMAVVGGSIKLWDVESFDRPDTVDERLVYLKREPIFSEFVHESCNKNYGRVYWSNDGKSIIITNSYGGFCKADTKKLLKFLKKKTRKEEVTQNMNT